MRPTEAPDARDTTNALVNVAKRAGYERGGSTPVATDPGLERTYRAITTTPNSVVFSHPQTVKSGSAPTTQRNDNAYGSLFLEPDLPAGTDDTTDTEVPEFVEPTSRPRRNQNRSNRRRSAA